MAFIFISTWAKEFSPAILVPTIAEGSEPIDEKRDHQAVDKIRKKAAYNGNQQISFDGRSIFIADRLHICHSVRGRPHSEAADTCRDDSRIIIVSHDGKELCINKVYILLA